MDPKLLTPIYDDLHRRLHARWQENPAGENVLALSELAERLWQLGWLLRQIVARDEIVRRNQPSLAQRAASGKQLSQTEIGELFGAVREVNLLAESFYLIAFRAREITHHQLKALRIRPKGVEGVRNHLIVHPEKPRGKATASYGYGPSGPQMKPGDFGNDDNTFHDSGLWPNAMEFATCLLARLSGPLQDISS